MSGMPDLPRGQKYNLKCCACGSAKIVRGVTQINEPEDVETWQATEQITEYQCDRMTCKKVSYMVVRVTAEGVTLQWRNVKDDARTGRLS